MYKVRSDASREGHVTPSERVPATYDVLELRVIPAAA